MRVVAIITALGFAAVLLFALGVGAGGYGFAGGFGLLLLGWLLHEHSTELRAPAPCRCGTDERGEP